MSGNSNQIAKFAINCNQTSNGPLVKSVNATSTKLISHFSATTLHVLPLTHEYWPGSVLLFNYSITDTFGNIISNYTIYNHSSIPFVINNSDLLLFEQFNIDKYGKCSLCDEGIVISEANLLKTLGGPYRITIDLQYDYLVLRNKCMDLIIVGCPIGYGATTNKYHCEKCSTPKFNLISNNTNECLSFDDHLYASHISQCSEYFASLHKYLYLLLLLIIPLIIICSVAIYCKQQYDKAFVVDKSLVLIIGVSQFDKKTDCLPGVKQNVYDLVELWKK
eukprot:232750_1